MQLKDELNPHAQRFLEILQCGYPQKPDEQERLHLMYFLLNVSEMTAREASYFIGRLIGLYYLDVIGDAYETMSTQKKCSKQYKIN